MFKNRIIKDTFFIFIFCLLVRSLFTFIYSKGPYDFIGDSFIYVNNAEKALVGNFNFDEGKFIRSPFYSILITGFKIISVKHWEILLIFFQIILSSFGSTFLYKITLLLFNKRVTAIFAGILYGIYLPIFYFVYSFTTEILYQSLSIIGIYFLLKALKQKDWTSWIICSIVFILCYLTRSQISLFFPLLFILILWNFRKNLLTGLLYCTSFCILFLFLTFPWAYINYKLHGEYILSSNGANFHFFCSNSYIGYMDAIETPPIESKEFQELQRFNIGYFTPFNYPELLKKSHTYKQHFFKQEAINWIKANPGKFIKLKIFNLFRFFIPGVSWKHYPFSQFILSFLISIPVYFFFFAGWVMALKKDFQNHLWFLAWFMSNFVFLVLFIFNTRYRTYGIEVFYLIYVAYFISVIIQKTEFGIRLHTKFAKQ